MFEGLTDRFQLIKGKLLGYGRITRGELDAVFKEIRISLLEADVNYKVVKEFIADLDQKIVATELSKSLKPGDLVIKAVYEELILLLGGAPKQLEFSRNDVTVISLIGLQGVGKTTAAAKLGVKYKRMRPLLVPADAKRPAAVQQLEMLANRADITTCPLVNNSAIATVKRAKELANKGGHGLIIIDTAGRLHIDDALIEELIEINQITEPDYRMLIADGMSGQDAVNQAKMFREKVGLEGAILTKMDGDARGGAALSITRVANVPIFFIGTSENLDGLEEFYPDRAAQRILGMGDMAGLVEKVRGIEAEIDQEKLRKKVIKGDLNLEDFLEQMSAVKKLGPIAKIAAMIPGVQESEIDDSEFKKIETIINSMTRSERQHPEIIDGSRKRRIAAGSGTTMADVNRLLKQFFYARDLLKKLGKGQFPGNIPFKI